MQDSMTEGNKYEAITIALAWCLAWGEEEQPQVALSVLQQMWQGMRSGGQIPKDVHSYIEQAEGLLSISEKNFPETLEIMWKEGCEGYREDYRKLWEEKTRIGLVYGGATKIKQYVFEASKLPDIRGASALLDRINLLDLPAFFSAEKSERFQACRRFHVYCKQVRAGWLDENFPDLSQALVPELVVYSTGGNLLALCPAAYVDRLANAIEKRYTEETLTANSCAVGETFRLLEFRFGLMKDPPENTLWLDWYRQHWQQPIVEDCYGRPEKSATQEQIDKHFQRRKSFNELVGKLTARFNQRRSGSDRQDENCEEENQCNGSDRAREKRPSRRYPPMLETHPYLRRDNVEKRSATFHAEKLPGSPWLSEVAARKRLVGQKSKRYQQSDSWFEEAGLNWNAGEVESWVKRFETFLNEGDRQELKSSYYRGVETFEENGEIVEAKSLRAIGCASDGFVGYIYADGNNMGGYIQKIITADDYQHFSDIVSEATEKSVYYALAQHIRPCQSKEIDDDDEVRDRNWTWIHPFEILTIGGDDVMLIVPANKALVVAQTICERFEKILLKRDPDRFRIDASPSKGIHRYLPEPENKSACKLSMSAGVLISAQDTPVYYAERLTNQLLKSAKQKAKQLKQTGCYYGGTIDFLVMKAVTMLSSEIKEFRNSGLIIEGSPKLKLYGAPYTLHEIGGLVATVRALQKVDFPRSQLYQIRSLLERGKQTAILNYRYFRVRFSEENQELLKEAFEEAWCRPKDPQNNGNLAPWMSLIEEDKTTTYETIWREIVDLYPFISEEEPHSEREAKQQTVEGKAETR